MKLEKKEMIGNASVEEALNLGNLKIYLSEHGDRAFLVNHKGNVLAIIDADCAQNTGFLQVRKPK